MRHEMSVPRPCVEIASSATHPAALVVALHGGRAWSRRPARRRHLTYLRMLPLTRLWNEPESTVTVWRLRYRYRGWNGDACDPVQDLRWALDHASEIHPGVPIILMGHSMGGRAALTAAGDARVVAACALAPWLSPHDPADQLRERRILIAHGDRDRITSHSQSREYAGRANRAGARVQFTTIDGDGHAMLRRPRRWHVLVRDFLANVCPVSPPAGGE